MGDPVEYKMYCVFAKESIDKMGGNRGKLGAMAGHAFLHAYWDAETTPTTNAAKLAEAYRKSGMAKKVCLVVDTVADLQQLQRNYVVKVGTSLVKDSGKTVFDEPTIVCLGIGPMTETERGQDLKDLKVLI